MALNEANGLEVLLSSLKKVIDRSDWEHRVDAAVCLIRCLDLLLTALSTYAHPVHLITVCTETVPTLKLLRHQGQPDAQPSVIANAVIVSRLLYALPAWGGFLSVELVNRINAFFRRLQCFGYLQCRMTVAEFTNKSDHDLFCKLCAPTHALNQLEDFVEAKFKFYCPHAVADGK